MLDRTKQPPFSNPSDIKVNLPEKVVLPGGGFVFFMRGGEQNVIRIEFIFHAGRWYEHFPGVSLFSSSLITKGTKELTRTEIARRLEELGYHIETNTSHDFASLAASGTINNLPEVLEILKDCLLHPVFPVQELDQEKDIYLENLRVSLEKTSYLASWLFRKQLFGESHPYALDPQEEHVRELTSEQLSAYYHARFRHFTVFVTGRIDHSVKSRVVEFISELPWKENKEPAHNQHGLDEALVSLKKPGAVQASLRMGKITISRDNPDYPALVLAVYILGGFFGSRLMKSIREEKGLTYSIYARIQNFLHASVFSIGTDINQEQADVAIMEIKNQIRKLRSEWVRSSELELAKNHFIGNMQNEMSNIFAHTERYKTIHFFNLPADYYSRLIHRVNSVNASELAGIYERYLHEDSMHTTLVH
jgi:predicted Zn-dependent peptidase